MNFSIKVHLAMVRYHEAGRFCEKDAPWDQISAMYHLERAAMCGELEAIVALGQCYLQLPHHILPEIELEVLSFPNYLVVFPNYLVLFVLLMFPLSCLCCFISGI